MFLSEGIQKFVYPAELGAGRFVKIGIPWPDVMGPFVATAETVCGALIIAGLFTRFAAADHAGEHLGGTLVDESADPAR